MHRVARHPSDLISGVVEQALKSGILHPKRLLLACTTNFTLALLTISYSCISAIE